MTRYSYTNLPPAGTKVKISPIKYLTSSLSIPDTDSQFFHKDIEGTVLPVESYISQLDRRIKLKHIVAVKTLSGEVILSSPDFLISREVDDSLKKERSTIDELMKSVADRINQLNNNS